MTGALTRIDLADANESEGPYVVTYQTTNSVSEGFTRFTTEDLVLLERLFNIRAYFSEYERLLYEYYATPDRQEILKQIATTSQLQASRVLNIGNSGDFSRSCRRTRHN